MSDGKLCPLLPVLKRQVGRVMYHDLQKCIGESCSFWVKDHYELDSRCSIPAIADLAEEIAEVAKQIRGL
jgi:hypothetical protein